MCDYLSPIYPQKVSHNRHLLESQSKHGVTAKFDFYNIFIQPLPLLES